jgi:hypothetical protein
MKKTTIKTIILLTGLVTGLTFYPEAVAGNKKLAQTGFEFLSVAADAKAGATANAMTSLEAGSSSLFFNPAGMANMGSTLDATASMNQWIADIRHNAFSVAIRPMQGRWGVLGFSFQMVDYGDFFGTQVDKGSTQGYRDTGTFEPLALAAGVGYAKALTDRFCVGGQVRWVKQRLGDSDIPVIAAGQDTLRKTVSNELTPLAFDFGTQFKTGIKSLVFGMSVRNFSKEIKYVEEGFQLPLAFNLGISMNVLDFFEGMPLKQTLYVSVDAVHYRSHPEQLRIGVDYRLLDILSLRGGYMTAEDESGLSFGMGVSYLGAAVDYAYTPFGVFDKVQRMTARFSL